MQGLTPVGLDRAGVQIQSDDLRRGPELDVSLLVEVRIADEEGVPVLLAA